MKAGILITVLQAKGNVRQSILTSVALLVIGVIFLGAACSSLTSPDQAQYGKYLVIEKTDFKRDQIGKTGKRQSGVVYLTVTATVKNAGSKVVTDFAGYVQLIDDRQREHREKIKLSRPMPPGDTREITVQIRTGTDFSASITSWKVVFEKVEIKEAVKAQEAANSPGR